MNSTATTESSTTPAELALCFHHNHCGATAAEGCKAIRFTPKTPRG